MFMLGITAHTIGEHLGKHFEQVLVNDGEVSLDDAVAIDEALDAIAAGDAKVKRSRTIRLAERDRELPKIRISAGDVVPVAVDLSPLTNCGVQMRGRP
jgi:hypothetical protein